MSLLLLLLFLIVHRVICRSKATANAKRVDGSFDVGQQTVEALLSRSGGWNAVVLNDYSQAPSKPKNHAKVKVLH